MKMINTGNSALQASVYLYTPYSLVKSIMALRFSGLTSSMALLGAMMKPPPLPTTSLFHPRREAE
jgi:hypothetical protein